MTKKSTYSFGEDSPLKFQISDQLAQRYNEAVDKFFKAQQRFNQKFGRPWDPAADPIEINWTRKQRKAWDEFAGVMNRQLTANGPYHYNDIMDDYLVKNVVSATISGALAWGRALPLATTSGALYGLLRGR